MQFQRRPTNELLKRKFSIITAKTNLDKMLFRMFCYDETNDKIIREFFFFKFFMEANQMVSSLFNCVKIQKANEIQKVVKIIIEEGQNNFLNLLS